MNDTGVTLDATWMTHFDAARSGVSRDALQSHHTLHRRQHIIKHDENTLLIYSTENWGKTNRFSFVNVLTVFIPITSGMNSLYLPLFQAHRGYLLYPENDRAISRSRTIYNSNYNIALIQDWDTCIRSSSIHSDRLWIGAYELCRLRTMDLDVDLKKPHMTFEIKISYFFILVANWVAVKKLSNLLEVQQDLVIQEDRVFP